MDCFGNRQTDKVNIVILKEEKVMNVKRVPNRFLDSLPYYSPCAVRFSPSRRRIFSLEIPPSDFCRVRDRSIRERN